MLTNLAPQAIRTPIVVLATTVALALGVTACGAPDPTDPETSGPTTTGATTPPSPGGPATSGSAPSGSPAAPSTTVAPVAPNDDAVVSGLTAQGYGCEGSARCERTKPGVVEVIEVGERRAVFLVRSTGGSGADLSSALTSVLDDYGSVLPGHRFAGGDWSEVTDWVAEHADDDTARGQVLGWFALLVTEGEVRKLVLEPR